MGFRAQQPRGDTYEGAFIASCCVVFPVRPLALSFLCVGCCRRAKRQPAPTFIQSLRLKGPWPG